MPRWDSSRISAFLVYEDTRADRHVDILTELSSRNYRRKEEVGGRLNTPSAKPFRPERR